MKTQETNQQKESAMHAQSNKWMSRGCGLLLVAIGIGLLPVTRATAVIVSLNDTGDTLLESANPNLNQGTANASFVGSVGSGADVGRDLFAFDLSSIPAGSTVNSATLRIAFTGNADATQTATLSLHQVTTSWTELGATWNNYDGVNPWGTAGGDYNATPSSSLTSLFAGSLSSRVDFSFTGLAADAQGWVNNPASNNGWILINASENVDNLRKQFWTKEQTSFAAQPILDLDYTTPVPEPTSVGLLMVGSLCLIARRHARKASR